MILLSIAASTTLIHQKEFCSRQIISNGMKYMVISKIDFFSSFVYISFVKSVWVLWLHESYKHQEFTCSLTLIHI